MNKNVLTAVLFCVLTTCFGCTKMIQDAHVKPESPTHRTLRFSGGIIQPQEPKCTSTKVTSPSKKGRQPAKEQKPKPTNDGWWETFMRYLAMMWGNFISVFY